MKARTPQILLLAALAAVGFLLWDVVIAPALVGGPSAAGGGAPISGSLLDAPATAADAGPTLSGRVDALTPQERAARAAAAAAAAAAGAAPGATTGGARVDFKGRVLGPDGRPVPGVRIALQGGGGVEWFETDANGRFDHAARPGRYSLLFDGGAQGGLQVASWMLDGAVDEDLEFGLQEPAAIVVSLRRGEEGVSGATVVATASQVGALGRYEGTTDLDGALTLEGVPPGRYRVVAEVPDGPLVHQTVTAPAGGHATVTVVVPDGVVLRGTVRSGENGPPVPGAALKLLVRPRTQGTFETAFESDGAGRFEVVVPQGRPVGFEVLAEGYAPWPPEAQRNAVLRSLKGLAKAGPVTRDVPLEGGAALRGVVQSEAKEGLPGIALRLRPQRGAVVTATAGEGGRYVFGQLNPGRYDVQIASPAYFPIQGQVMRVDIPRGSAPAPQTLDITLVVARRLEGVVLSPAGEPAVGARVWIVGGGREVRSARDSGRVLECFTEAGGRWAIEDIPPDRDVVVRAAMGTLEADPVPARHATPPPLPIRMQLRSTGVLRGTVLDIATRETVAGARVRLRPEPADGRTGTTTVTDPQGAFVVEGVLPGGWSLAASKTGYLEGAAETVQVARSEDTRVSLPLDPGLVFAGVVVDEAGRPLGYARITLRGTPDGTESALSRAVGADQDGRFRLSGFAPGVYELSAWRRNYRRVKLDGLRHGESALRIVLPLAQQR